MRTFYSSSVFEFKKLRKLKLLLFFGGLMNTKKQQRKTF